MLLQRSSSSKLSYHEQIRFTMATYVKDRASPIDIARFTSLIIIDNILLAELSLVPQHTTMAAPMREC
ncbi:hypothetical protein DPMN_018378 [Dreissena polymorpha]|uniref:Uncharacterized protein n=1 Tax=Dreissena polymorpha TaxID=45954 RepID=A0A9D4NJ87_DREPO|nr:hypothetical protein DPMN_018378 [Dreissena polymorpha]